MKIVRHPNIVRLHEVCTLSSYLNCFRSNCGMEDNDLSHGGEFIECIRFLLAR